jgi:hypothetical protein
MGVLLVITARHCPQSTNGPHRTTTQAPGKHTSHDIKFKNPRIMLAIPILCNYINLLNLSVSDTSCGFGMMFHWFFLYFFLFIFYYFFYFFGERSSQSHCGLPLCPEVGLDVYTSHVKVHSSVLDA